MLNRIEAFIEQYEQGTLSRRQLISALLLLAVPAAGKAQSATPIAPGLTLNHVHLDVVDLDKSIQFYRDLFGATIRDRSPGGNATLSLPGEPTKPTWMSLTTTREASGRYNHVGFGIDFDAAKGDAERLAGEINAKYPESNAQPVGQTISGPNTRSVYVYDPSGIRFQILPKEDDGWLPTGFVGSKILSGEQR